MAEAGLFIRWGEPVRGREPQAVEVFNETVQYFALLQQEGKIENFDMAVFMPHGPDNGGYFMLRGSAQQIDSVRNEHGFWRLLNRVRLRVNDLGVVNAFVDEGIAQVMSLYEEEVGMASQPPVVP
ncbi:MAG: hypothetical protein ACM4D3_24590 [Candidatus Sericytochromatia bacterium]